MSLWWKQHQGHSEGQRKPILSTLKITIYFVKILILIQKIDISKSSTWMSSCQKSCHQLSDNLPALTVDCLCGNSKHSVTISLNNIAFSLFWLFIFISPVSCTWSSSYVIQVLGKIIKSQSFNFLISKKEELDQ